MNKILLLLLLLKISNNTCHAQATGTDTIRWTQTVTISNEPIPAGADSTWSFYGHYGSEYARLLKLKDGSWLASYTISTNKGYAKDSTGGLQLQISKSTDGGKHWAPFATIKEAGRDVDNAQLIQLKDGTILLACRSVRWFESYRLPVYKSNDGGKSWQYLSTIDSNEGKAGELGKPDKGAYEPHLFILDDGRLSVMYANEKHVTEMPSYSQIIAQKTSEDNGKTWGKEVWVAYEEGHNASRPGMPVWTKMKNSEYIVVYEICGPEKCNIYYKRSKDGISWPSGLGTLIPDQLGGPFVLSLPNGNLLVTSNSSNLSLSKDYGLHWQTINRAFNRSLWPAMYVFDKDEVGIVSAQRRSEGGNSVQIRFGHFR